MYDYTYNIKTWLESVEIRISNISSKTDGKWALVKNELWVSGSSMYDVIKGFSWQDSLSTILEDIDFDFGLFIKRWIESFLIWRNDGQEP